jgi:hypothetical protein
MKRNAFDDRRDQAVADDYLGSHLPCRVCDHSTSRDELSQLGGRCTACHADWCAQANPAWWPNRPLRPHERAAVIRRARTAAAAFRTAPDGRDSRQWARDLKARDLAGERLAPHLRAAWREALREPEPAAEEVAHG